MRFRRIIGALAVCAVLCIIGIVVSSEGNPVLYANEVESINENVGMYDALVPIDGTSPKDLSMKMIKEGKYIIKQRTKTIEGYGSEFKHHVKTGSYVIANFLEYDDALFYIYNWAELGNITCDDSQYYKITYDCESTNILKDIYNGYPVYFMCDLEVENN